MVARLSISELERGDLPFRTGRDRRVLRWADEFPDLRGWSRSDDPEVAWESHRRDRAVKGPTYAQFIVHLGRSVELYRPEPPNR